MRIALFSDSYLPTKSGIVTVVIQLKHQLENLGHEVFLVTVETTPEYRTDDPHFYRAKSHALGLGTDQFISLPSQRKINKFLKDNKIDIIHCHTEFGIGKAGVKAAKKLHIPAICTIHTMWVDFYKYYVPCAGLISPKTVDRFMNRFYRNFNALIGVSTKARNYYKKPGMLPNLPSVVIPNAIDKEKFGGTHITPEERLELRKKYDIDEKDVVLLFVGRIAEEKRILELVELCKKITAETPDCKALFVGKGPAYEAAVKCAKNEIAAKKIIFTGFIDWTEVHKIYESSDIFITASLSEMHSMTILEAQLCGMPIAARKDESYLDSIYDGENGYLSDTDEELGQKIRELVLDKEKRIAFGKRSLEITKNFSLETNVKKTTALYEQVMKVYPEPVDESAVAEILKQID